MGDCAGGGASADWVSTVTRTESRIRPPADRRSSAGTSPANPPRFRESLRRIWELLTPRERRRFGLVIGGMLLVALIETAGVGSIGPFMALVSDPGLINEHESLTWVFTTLGFESTYGFLLFAGAAVLAFIILSNGLSAGVTWLMLRFIWSIHHRISRDLLKRYLWQPYSYFITRNTADLTTNILSEAVSITAGMLSPALKALSRAVVAVGIIALLLAVDYKLALISGAVLGGMYALAYLAIRTTLGRIGDRRLTANTNRFRMAGEALQGIKDVKVLGREREFLDRYSRESIVFSRYSASSQILSSLPRFALETIAFGGMVAILLYLMAVRADFRAVVPIISLYAFAGYRLMPALQKVFDGLTRVRFYGAPLATLHRDLMRSPPETPVALPQAEREMLPFRNQVEVCDLVFRYPGAEEPAIRNVSFTIKRNQTVAFVGATGCGKTTLVDILMGLLWPEHGEIRVDGSRLTNRNVRSWQRQIGYVPQQIYLSDDTIARNIAFGVPDDEIGLPSVKRAAGVANLDRFIHTLPAGYQTVVGDRGVRLSGGQRQRIGIARALYGDPAVLILDEATSSLDGVTEDAVMEAIRTLANHKTIVLIAHRLTTVENADRVYFMKDGVIADEGTHAELLEQSAEFRAMAGTFA